MKGLLAHLSVALTAALAVMLVPFPTDAISSCGPLPDDCNNWFCNRTTGLWELLVPKPDGTACNANNLCTQNNVCSGGVCVGTPLPGINDGNPCTTDSCDPATGVITHTPGICTSPPATPVLSGPASAATGSYSLTWSASAGATKYTLYENNGILQDNSATSISIVAKAPGTYSYQVAAYDPAGYSANSNTVTLTVPLGSAVADTPAVDPVVPAQGQVGTLAGKPSVDGGAANYHIAIEVPPGRGGMSPDVSLGYSSKNGNGVAGVGWSLNASASIYRCPRTLEQDGANRPVMMDDRDALCFAGQRLVLSSGAFGQTGSTYVTEINPFDRFTLNGTLSSGTSSFLVEKKSGRRQAFTQLANAPDVWRLTTEVDRSGSPNCVMYTYGNLAPSSRGATVAEWQLQSITYTGTYSGNIPTGVCAITGSARTVSLFYETRPDARTTYRAGVATLMTQRLTAIETRVGGVLARRYEFAYRLSPATGRSLLANSTVCSSSPCNGSGVPATTFSYQGAAPSFSPRRVMGDQSGLRVVSGDYDGDGTRDVFESVTNLGVTTSYVLLSSLGGRRLEVPATMWIDPAGQAPDVDGDGRADVVGFLGVNQVQFGHVEIGPDPAIPGNFIPSWVWTPGPVLPAGVCSAAGCIADRALIDAVDFDGDGLVDLRVHHGGSPTIIRRTGAGITSFDPDGTHVLNPWVSGYYNEYFDANGDGTVDTIVTPPGIAGGTADQVNFLAGFPGMQDPRPAATGLITAANAYLPAGMGAMGGPAWNYGSGHRLWLDLNGDGLRDVIYMSPGTAGTVTPYINHGGSAFGMPTQFAAISAAMTAADFATLTSPWAAYAIAADIDGDGMDEVLVPVTRSVNYCMAFTNTSTGENLTYCGLDIRDKVGGPRNGSADYSLFTWDAFKFTEQADWTFAVSRTPSVIVAPINTSIQAMDANGDGMVDFHYLLFVDPAGVNSYYMDGSSGQYSVFNSAPAPDLLTGAKNGLGATAAWSHLPLSPYLQTTYAANPNLPACTEALLKTCVPCAQAPLYTVNLNDHPPGYARFSSSMWVASRFDQSNGLSGSPPNTTCYRYQDAMLNILGRGFQGFRKIIAEDRLGPAQGEPATTSLLSVNNLRTTMEFNQVFPFSNTAKRVTVQRQNDGAVLSDTVSWWQAVPGSTSGTWAVYASASEARRFDPDAGVQMDATANNLVNFAMSRKLTVVDGFDALSGEPTVSCSFSADYLQNRAQRGAPVNGPVPLSSLVSRETRTISPPTLDWWLGRVDRTTSVSDRLATTAYPSLAARPDTTTMAPTAICPTVWSAEAKSQSADYTYYQTGTRRLLSAAIAPSTGLVESTTSYSYDGFGNLAATSITARDIVGTLQTLYGVSADSYFVETEVNPLGHVKTSRKSASNGLPVFEQAVQGAPAKSTTYDYLGRVLSVTVDGSRPLFQRLAACGGPSCGSARVVRQTLQGGAPTITEYLDELGRAIQVTKDGFAPGSLVSSEVTYNERGLKLSESQPHYLPDSVYLTSYSGFDVLGRPGRKTVQRDPGLFVAASIGLPLAVTDYVQDGFKTHVYAYKPGTQSTPGVSPAIQMSRTYDSGGRLVETTQLDDRGGTGPIRASYLYDPAGHLTHIIDLAGNDIAATYDDFGRKLQVSDPDRGVWTYAWDGLGRLETQTDARGVKQSFTYDATGRTTHRGTTSSGGVLTGESDWTYDLDGQVGVLSSIQTAPGYYVTDAPGFFRRFTYDQLLRPIQVTTTIRGDDVFVTSASGQSRTFVQQFAYDANYGRLKLRTTSSALGAGEAWALDYDGSGELVGETRLLFTSTVSRDKQYRLVTGMSARGQVTDQRLGNCIQETNTFDASTGLSHMLSAMRPLNATSLPMTIAGASCGAATDLVRQDLYDYDHFLNLHQYTKQIAAKELHEVFGYDDLQRMTSAARCTGAGCVPGAPDTFGFDDLGNVRSKSDFATGYTYRTGPNTGGLGGPHAVSSVTKLDATVASYGYDANGNMVSGDGRTLTFDLMDRPVVVTQGTTTTEFAYAADGSRYRQVVKGNSTYGPRTVYSIDKDYELVVWLDGTIEERTYIGPSVVVQTSRATISSPVVRSARYQLVDRLGSVQASTDETPQAALLGLDVHDFDAWGKPRAWDESSTGGALHLSAKGVTTDRGFTGHEHLDAHQLIHMNGRIYDYNLGRFLSVDPIISNPANAQSINPYSYIGNNPLSGTDPTGYEESLQVKERVSDAAWSAQTGSHLSGGFAGGRVVSGWNDKDVKGSNASKPGAPSSGAVGATPTQHPTDTPNVGGNRDINGQVPSVGNFADKLTLNGDPSDKTTKGAPPVTVEPRAVPKLFVKSMSDGVVDILRWESEKDHNKGYGFWIRVKENDDTYMRVRLAGANQPT